MLQIEKIGHRPSTRTSRYFGNKFLKISRVFSNYVKLCTRLAIHATQFPRKESCINAAADDVNNNEQNSELLNTAFWMTDRLAGFSARHRRGRLRSRSLLDLRVCGSAAHT